MLSWPPSRVRKLGARTVTDFEIEGFGQDWLLTPTSRASRRWCRSNMSDEVPMAGESYVVQEPLMLSIIEKFMDRKTGWFRF